ncbi:MAG: DNA adenine methylase [Peptostreptococcaceae bacterium]
MNANPIVKWAGGKRQLMDKLLELMPKEYKNYYEPFIGGGALLFALMPTNATINDVNQDLLAIYKCLSGERLCKSMIKELEIHEKNHNEDYYYQTRELDRAEDFENISKPKRAARAIYLNKTCFNGLYRVNSNGYFNVPSAKKETVNTFDRENIKLLHEYFLSGSVTIKSGDFKKAVSTAQEGDFVYFDPPYDSFDDKESFTAYTKFDFSRDDQRRLAEVFRDLTNRGVKVMLSNHNTSLIRELYSDFNINVVNVKRMINSNGNDRGPVEEVIITNY